MAGLQWQTPQVAEVVDVAALNKSAMLPDASLKTAELINLYPPAPAPKPNYAPTQSSFMSALSSCAEADNGQTQPISKRALASALTNHHDEDSHLHPDGLSSSSSGTFTPQTSGSHIRGSGHNRSISDGGSPPDRHDDALSGNLSIRNAPRGSENCIEDSGSLNRLSASGGIPVKKKKKRSSCEKLKADEELMAALNDPEQMQEFREQYDSEKKEDSLKAIQVSKKLAAKFVAGKVNQLQQEADFLVEAMHCQMLGFVARGSWDHMVHSCYYGTGPGNEFLRKNFKIGAQDMAILWKNHICKLEKCGDRQLTQGEIDKELAKLITSCLHEITGLNNILMSYTAYARAIVVPHKVRIVGWPEEVTLGSPQKLSAENVRAVYQGWKMGTIRWERMSFLDHKLYVQGLENDGKLNPKSTTKRSDAGGSHKKRKRTNGDDGNEDKDDRRSQKKKSKGKCSNRRNHDNNEDSEKKSPRSKEAKGEESLSGLITKGLAEGVVAEVQLEEEWEQEQEWDQDQERDQEEEEEEGDIDDDT
ncbi:hypothetical protein BDP27DRAFT_1424734 [Rhodocollybia butyracea]|uniref:Uncharacterized protein n=1 Tax=Rhodocollybia butyracea TaxID=206335 RepID=A0A9P5PN45_9AGAR|nr:hypothetical protein BDP27DRAFT_1424734 [Rhodocollybia butyracea]